jgi:hypothetical protein
MQNSWQVARSILVNGVMVDPSGGNRRSGWKRRDESAGFGGVAVHAQGAAVTLCNALSPG